jgi:phosphate transport system ATP-binding protein
MAPALATVAPQREVVAHAAHRAPAPVTLEVRGLGVSYAGTTRLDNVSVAFERNRVSAILGPSGCGKSTLLRALNRTLELIPGARIDVGAVLLDGRDIYEPSMPAGQIRAQIGILQQKPTPFPMSILDNALFGARYHGLTQDEHTHARAYLERVGLWNEVKDRLKSSALALSGGQQQRLCLARTLAVQPSIILMDEPCSALDPRASGVIEGMIRELAREYTIVIVTHNIAQARRVADACVFMLDGRVLEAGSRDQVLMAPADPTVRAFVTGELG